MPAFPAFLSLYPHAFSFFPRRSHLNPLHPPAQTLYPHPLPCMTLPTSPKTISSSPLSLLFLSNNTFTLSSATHSLIIDPWLTSDLTFFHPLFFLSKKPQAAKQTISQLNLQSFSALILTQSLADHAHPPSLKLFPRSIPIFAPYSAEPLLTEMGFQNLTFMKPGDSHAVAPAFTITAVRGSVVGPPWSDPMLAYLFTLTSASGKRTTVYHEPHGNHDQHFLKKFRATLDAVIAPVVSTKIPLLANYPLVNGVEEAVALCQMARPKLCVTFDNSGGEQTGALATILESEGGLSEFAERIDAMTELKEMKIVNLGGGQQIGIGEDEHE